MPELPVSFLQAPEEVQRYFREKRSIPTFDWRDITPEEHAYSWTVAKSTGFDVLDDIRTAVDEAIVNRVPFETFRQQLTPVLQAKGWWGRRLAEDPKSGDLRVVQLGSPRRLRTIYWANTRTAHAAGEWERSWRTRRFLPFLVYQLSSAENKRPEHRSWVGTVLPVDDPWWSTHYPPNGWGCKCHVRQISRREAERLGWSGEPKRPPLDLRPWHNKRTGEAVMVPRGIDPGWDTNPGKTRTRMMTELLSGRLDRVPLRARPAAVADLVASPLFKGFVDDAIKVGLERASVVEGLRAEGLSGTALEARLQSDHPFTLTRMPVAIASARFGDDYWPVTIDAATIGHAADHRRVPIPETWKGIENALRSGRAKRDANGVVRIFDPLTRLFFVIEPFRKGWRVRTAFAGASERYFGRQIGEEL